MQQSFMKKLFLLTITLAIFTAIISAQTCQQLADNGTCDFYPKCMEENNHCGPTGYPMGYGNKYCSKFTKFMDVFPPQGKEWIRKTLICLKTALLPIVKGSTCKVIFDTAFDSHPRCYIESGFCDMFLDVQQLPDLMKALVNVYEIKDFASALSMKQIFVTAQMCGGDYLNKMTEALKKIFEH